MNDLCEIWGRFGVTLQATADEVNALVLDPDGEGAKAVARLFAEGRARLDGECYIPEVCVEEFNMKYGTSYIHGDVELDASFVQDKTIRVESINLEAERGSDRRNRGDAR